MKPSVIVGTFALLQFASAGSNSLFAAQAVVEQTLLQQLADISIIVVALAVIALIVMLVVTLRQVVSAQGKLMDLAESVKRDLTPAIANVKTLSVTAIEMSASVKSTIDSVDQTVNMANDRVRSTLDLAYQRVQQIDTLLGVAQREAEDAVITAASTVRGVKSGLSALTGESSAPRRSRRERQIAREIVVEDEVGEWDEDLDSVRAAESHGRGEPLFPDAEPGPSIHHRRSGPGNNQ